MSLEQARSMEAMDAHIMRLRHALHWISAHYEDVNINHVDFRVEAKRRADEALGKVSDNTDGAT